MAFKKEISGNAAKRKVPPQCMGKSLRYELVDPFYSNGEFFNAGDIIVLTDKAPSKSMKLLGEASAPLKATVLESRAAVDSGLTPTSNTDLQSPKTKRPSDRSI